MSRRSRREFLSAPLYGSPSPTTTTATSTPTFDDDNNMELKLPIPKLEGLDHDDIREAAYEIFFTSCRSSPGFGGRNTLTFYSSTDNHGNGADGGNGSGSSNGRTYGIVMTPTSRVKRALGLKMLKRHPSRRMSMSSFGFSPSSGNNGGSLSPSSPVSHGHNSSFSSSTTSSPGLGFSTLSPSRPRRPLTSAELMRQQMKVTEQCDGRLRKTLVRTLAGQMGRRSETIIVPLELLKHLKPSEFNDSYEYHFWQRRQLKMLETGLILHPSIPVEKSNSFALRLSDIVRSSESKPIDTSKNSDMMRTLCNSVVSLSWRSANGNPSHVCHWVDGFPLNIHIYTTLLQAIFDIKDETLVLDEVDELLELMKKTWSTLGISRRIHNICFTWVLFHQYVVTNQMESDLLSAAHAMLAEVTVDAKKPDKEATYAKLLSSMLVSMQIWAEKKLLDYHEHFNRHNIHGVEYLLPLALSIADILGENFTITEGQGNKKGDTMLVDGTRDHLDHYIRSSMKNAFEMIIENEKVKIAIATAGERKEASEALLRLAKETEDLAVKEKSIFSPILKRWHLIPAGVAAVTLHHCYGAMLKQYVAGTTMLNGELVGVLQRAGKLERFLVQMVVEDSEECEDGGKGIVREMMPYEVDSILLKLLRQWTEERLKKGKDLLSRAKETETWNPKSKSDPYAQSTVELVKFAKEAVNDFFVIPVGITEDLVLDLANGLEQLFQEYTIYVASCGSKHNYLPALPPLTRCNRDSKFFKLWKKATPCSVGLVEMQHLMTVEGHHPRPATSRGTQRLYIRLNSLHYLVTHLNSLDKTLTLSPKVATPNRSNHKHRQSGASTSYFERVHKSIRSACDHVSEIAAYRLIFFDSNSVFYESLYVGDVTNARIRPAIRILKQNLTLLAAILTDRAQSLVMKEVMKASFEAFLMVLLAGGVSRIFHRSDHEMIEEDFDSLKRVFCSCGEGLISEDVVEREAETVVGVITLMSHSTEQLLEDFIIITCEKSGMGLSTTQKLPMPPTTGRWNRTDPNTILRVLCHRNDRAANQFLKKSFQLAKRK